MVKREKSPEVTEDIRLFVVWNPYPLNPNWVYEQDVQNCAEWVAEVVEDESYLISIHAKPSSRGMVLLEISKEFTNHGRLLGEHHWSHFLKDVTNAEDGHKTCVYYSIYSTCREASKDGWRPKPIPAKCFKNWSPGSGRFVLPYPESGFCPLPPEDRTSKQICRHIPPSVKPPPPKISGPESVVGSAAWIAQQKVPISDTAAGNSRKQDEMKSPATTSIAATLQTTIGEVPAELHQRPEPSMTILTKSKSKAIPLQQFLSPVEVPKTMTPAWVGRCQSSPSSLMQRPSAKSQNAWENPPKIVPDKRSKVTTRPDYNNPWQNSHEIWADVVEEGSIVGPPVITPDKSVSPTVPKSPLSVRGNFNLRGLEDSLDEAEGSPNPAQTPFQASDDEYDMEDLLAPPGTFTSGGNTNVMGAFTEADGPSRDNDWGTEWSHELEKKKQPDILCPTHGPACPRKICLDYKKLEREQKREEAKKNGEWRGRGQAHGQARGRGRGRRPF